MTAYVQNACAPPHLVDDRDPPAIALLKEDHQVFRGLFDLIETIGGDILLPVAGELCIRLAIHMNLEEEFLYPSLKSVLDAEEIGDALLDHRHAKRLISNIMEMPGPEATLRAKLRTLGEEVIRHADQEDRELLRDARRVWEEGRADLVRVGVRMQSRRRDLFALVRSIAGDGRAFYVGPPADAARRPARFGAPVGPEAWLDGADRVSHGRR